MKIVKKEDLSIKQISGYLEKYVIVHPTDTVYGLGCSALNSDSIERIRKIKKNDTNKSYLVLIASWEMLHKICDVSATQLNWLRDNWSGAVTAILPAKNKGTIAVRWPKNSWLEDIILELNAPVVSTSCNITGQDILNRVDNLDNYFKDIQPDIIIDGGELEGKPSAMYDLTGEEIKKVR